MTSFFSERANRPLQINGRQYKFDPVGFAAGNFHGVLTVDGQAEADLHEAVSKRLGVTVISEAEANQLILKAGQTPPSRVSSGSTAAPRPVALAQVGSLSETKGQEAAPSAESATQQTTSPSPGDKPNVEDIIRIERVAPPELFIEDKQRTGNAVEKMPKKRKAK